MRTGKKQTIRQSRAPKNDGPPDATDGTSSTPMDSASPSIVSRIVRCCDFRWIDDLSAGKLWLLLIPFSLILVMLSTSLLAIHSQHQSALMSAASHIGRGGGETRAAPTFPSKNLEKSEKKANRKRASRINVGRNADAVPVVKDGEMARDGKAVVVKAPPSRRASRSAV